MFMEKRPGSFRQFQQTCFNKKGKVGKCRQCGEISLPRSAEIRWWKNMGKQKVSVESGKNDQKCIALNDIEWVSMGFDDFSMPVLSKHIQ